MKNIRNAIALILGMMAVNAGTAVAGPVFLTGHDPDFHTQAGAGANLLRIGLSYALGGTANFNDNVHKVLWVESFISPPGGHLVGANSLPILGLTAGVDYDWVDAAGFTGATLSNYSAIGIASTFGGVLTAAELSALIGRSADIASFVNSGGGLFASAECYPCGANLAGSAANLFGFVPVTVTSIGASAPFTVTPFGAGLGLLDSDLNDPTHNSFGLVGGLNIVDTDAAGHATTLAGNVRIGDGGFTPVDVPEPATLGLFAAGFLSLGAMRRRRNAKA